VSTARPRRLRPRLALAGTRLLTSGAAGVVVFGIAVALGPWQAAVLLGWDTIAAVLVAWVFTAVWSKDAAGTAELATREDDSRVAADVLLVTAAVASLAGVGVGLVKAGREHGSGEAAITAIAVLAVVLAWAAVHAVFTLHYARLYYAEGGGIAFGDGAAPDYRDFAYLALTIGMTYQVSDTPVGSREIRRAVTRHALLSYLFGTVVIAMTINVVAGLLR
jgi:uncharacterized membrane protein